MDRAYSEVEILKTLGHPRIVQLYEVRIRCASSGQELNDAHCKVIETDTHLHLAMELAPQGELFDYIVAYGRIKVRTIAIHTCCSSSYCSIAAWPTIMT